MTNIGHNGGPSIDPFDAMQKHILDLYELAEGALTGKPIESQEQADQLAALKDDIKQAAKDAEAARKDEKKPHDDAAKAVQAKWKPLVDKCDLAATTAAKALTPWLIKLQADKDAEAQRLRELADERAGAAQQAFNVTDLSERGEAEQLAKEAAKAKAAANKIDRGATGLRTYWTFQIDDFGALLKFLKEARGDELKAMLTDYVDRSVKAGARSIPGVNIQAEKRVT